MKPYALPITLCVFCAALAVAAPHIAAPKQPPALAKRLDIDLSNIQVDPSKVLEASPQRTPENADGSPVTHHDLDSPVNPGDFYKEKRALRAAAPLVTKIPEYNLGRRQEEGEDSATSTADPFDKGPQAKKPGRISDSDDYIQALPPRAAEPFVTPAPEANFGRRQENIPIISPISIDSGDKGPEAHRKLKEIDSLNEFGSPFKPRSPQSDRFQVANEEIHRSAVPGDDFINPVDPGKLRARG